MSKAVLISIRKEHNDNIFAGKKKWEGRKTCPGNVEIKNYKDPTSPYNKSADDVKFIVYEPKAGGGCGKVVGEFICDFAQIFQKYEGRYDTADYELISEALCVSADFARLYFNKGKGYMIRINAPKKYDTPKELSEFRTYDKFYDESIELGVDKTLPITRPPQSWCYVEEIQK